MSTSSPLDLSAALPCYRCGYDVRAQSADGSCPECEALVVDSQRMALIPHRPAWRDSDPRWRRRMLAGAWVLALLPLMSALQANSWAKSVPVPMLFAVQAGQSLDQSFLSTVYVYLVFCIGVVLLFAKERGRQYGMLDWTRRWGVICSYLVALLGFVKMATIPALVILGIGALLQSMPLSQQPAVTGLFVRVSTGYIFYGPSSGWVSDASLAGFSAVAMALACVPLFNALRCSGPKALATILLVPLVLASVIQVVYAGLHASRFTAIYTDSVYSNAFYFNAEMLGEGFEKASGSAQARKFIGEAIKWSACLGIALWLSIAQIAAIGRRGKAR